jgi:hypothetical protein
VANCPLSGKVARKDKHVCQTARQKDRKTDSSPISPHLTLPFVHALSPLPTPLPKGFDIEDMVVNVDVGLVGGRDDYRKICDKGGGENRRSLWVSLEVRTLQHFLLVP